MSDDLVTYKSEKEQKKCKHEREVLINYSAAWHDGDVVCQDCGKHIRSYDAG